MKTYSTRIALALAATLIAISSTVGGADATSAGSADRTGADRGATQIQDGANRNSPHPAVLSYEHPVYPIKVPNPPVGLEHY